MFTSNSQTQQWVNQKVCCVHKHYKLTKLKKQKQPTCRSVRRNLSVTAEKGEKEKSICTLARFRSSFQPGMSRIRNCCDILPATTILVPSRHRITLKIEASLFLSKSPSRSKFVVFFCRQWAPRHHKRMLLFCAMTNKFTIISQIITMLHVSTWQKKDERRLSSKGKSFAEYFVLHTKEGNATREL